jgi:hypothetical protein
MWRNNKFCVLIKNISDSITFGLKFPLLPRIIYDFYDSFIMKGLRVLGGFSVLLCMTKYHLCFNTFIYCIIIVLFIIHSIHIVILVTIKVVYIIVVFRFLNLRIDVRLYKILIYVTVGIRVIIIVFIECVGLLGVDVFQCFDLYTNINEIKNCSKKKK